MEPCDRCRLYARNPYLICTQHPTGPAEPGYCPDFEPNPALEPEEQWEPEGASYYNGELILDRSQRRTRREQWDLLDSHPIFTRRCPQCEMPYPQGFSGPHWDCPHCGWRDDCV